MKNHWVSYGVALFFALLTGIGLLTAADYGLPCDEPAEQVILKENIMEYAYQLLGTDSAAVSHYEEMGIRRISDSIERDHGQAAYYLATPLLALMPSKPDLMTALWHAYTWLWFMLGVVSLYCLTREIGLSKVIACAASLMLYLSPRFFAEGHYNNKDIVLLALILLTLATGARMLREPSAAKAIIFSLAGALATNTKIIGVFAWGLMGLALLFTFLFHHPLNIKYISAGLTAILTFIVFFILLTPATWGDPLSYFSYVVKNAGGFTRWTGVVLYQGFSYAPTQGLPLPHMYLPTMIAITVPVSFLLLSALGQVRALVLCIRGDARRPLLVVLTLLWLVPLAYVVVAQPLLYNGWRHFYFLYAGMLAMGAIGLQTVWEIFRRDRIRRTIFSGILGIMFFVQAIGIAINHPYQYAYYNILASTVQHHYELDYWNVSTINAMRALVELRQSSDTQPLNLGARDAMSMLGLTQGYAVLDTQMRSRINITKSSDAPYLFYNETYADIYGIMPPQGYHAMFSLISYGNALCTMYERD